MIFFSVFLVAYTYIYIFHSVMHFFILNMKDQMSLELCVLSVKVTVEPSDARIIFLLHIYEKIISVLRAFL